MSISKIRLRRLICGRFIPSFSAALSGGAIAPLQYSHGRAQPPNSFRHPRPAIGNRIYCSRHGRDRVHFWRPRNGTVPDLAMVLLRGLHRRWRPDSLQEANRGSSVRPYHSTCPSARVMSLSQKPRRRWFRFGLRTFLVVVMLMACTAWWVTAQLKWIKDRRAALASVTRTYGSIWNQPRKAPWSLRLFGEHPAMVIFTPSNGKPTAKEIQQLFPEANVLTDPSDQPEWARYIADAPAPH